MTNENPSNLELYKAINSSRLEIKREINRRFDKIEIKVDKNTAFRNQLTGKIVVLVGIIGIGVNFLYDLIFRR